MKVALLAPAHKMHTWRWANALASHGIETVLFSDTPPSPSLVYHNVKILHPDWTLWRKLLVFKVKGGPLANNRDKWRAYEKLIDKESPDILHAHEALSYGPTLAHFPQYRRVLSPWGPDMELLSSDREEEKSLVQQAVQAADIITTNAPGLEKHWAGLSNQPIEKFNLFSWGVNTSTFHPRSKTDQEALLSKLSIPNNSPLLLSPRLAKPHYQILELINAWENVSTPGHLVILKAGADDSSWNEISNKTSQLGNITLINDFLTPDEMAILYTACKRVVMIPKTDLLASSLLEAMACGCLPLVNDLPCYRTVLNDIQSPPEDKGVGVFCEAKTLQEKITRSLSIPEDQFSTNQNYIPEHHQEEAQVLRLINEVYG
jgi:glycosyltransferase involved in cell wall biosynthesis